MGHSSCQCCFRSMPNSSVDPSLNARPACGPARSPCGRVPPVRHRAHYGRNLCHRESYDFPGIWRSRLDDTARAYSGATCTSMTQTLPALRFAHAFGDGGGELGRRARRAETDGALAAREHGEVDRRIAHAQADRAVLDRPSAHARHALLMQLVVEERLVVGDDDRAAEYGSARRSTAPSRPSGSRRRRAPRPAGARCRATPAPRRPPCRVPSRCRRRRRSRCSRADRRSGSTRRASRAAGGCRRDCAAASASVAVRAMPSIERRPSMTSGPGLSCAAWRVGRRARWSGPQRLEQAFDQPVRRCQHRTGPWRAAPDSPCSSRCARTDRASTG